MASHAAQALSRQLKDLTQQLQFFTEFKDYLEDLGVPWRAWGSAFRFGAGVGVVCRWHRLPLLFQ